MSINVHDPKRYTVNGKPATRAEYLNAQRAKHLAELKSHADAAPAKNAPAKKTAKRTAKSAR